MIRTLRILFLGRLLREKLLLTAFVLLAVLWWLSNFTGRLSHFLQDAHHTSSALDEQSLWLAKRQTIEQAAQAAAGNLDASRTLDAVRLLAEVSAMAGEAGLRNTTSGESQDVSNGQLSIHSLTFSVQKADWTSLENFYLALQKRSPYIGIEQFSVIGDRANPALLNATLHISSVEISR